MQSLPYNKADSVADLDAGPEVKPKPRKKPAPAVPASRCRVSGGCSLRPVGKCTPMHCLTAQVYVDNKAVS